MKRLKRKTQLRLTLVFAIVCVVAIIGVVWATLNGSKKEEQKGDYQVVKIEKSAPLLFNGVAQPKESRTFTLDPTLGTIETIHVQNNQQVKAGDVLATYKNQTIEEQVSQQEQALNKLNLAVSNAQSGYNSAVNKKNQLADQYNQLNKSVQALQAANDPSAAEVVAQMAQIKEAYDAAGDAVTQAKQGVDSANLEYSDAQKAIAQLKEKINTQVTAPFDGIVYVDQNGKTQANVPYATLVSPGTVVQASVTEYDYNKIKQGQKVEVMPANDERKIEGTITNISTLPESASATPSLSAAVSGGSSNSSSSTSSYAFTVETAEEIHNGFSVQVAIHFNQITVPKEVVIDRDGKQYVYTYKDGKAHLTEVTVKDQGANYLVEKGLAMDDKYILNPDKKLKDNQEVAVFE